MPGTRNKGGRKLKPPKFANETEEARRWAAHQDDIAGAMQRAAANGSLGRGTVSNRGVTPTTTIRLAAEDISRLREQAQRKGLRYQTYLKMLVREALLAGERKAG